MYQLSHLLAEQRALLSAQQEMSLFGKQSKTEILHNIHSFTHLFMID